MRSTRIIGAAALAVSSLVLTGVTGVSASATQKTEITDINPSHPITGETFHVKGTITTHITRGVDLERRFHDTWKVVTSWSTNDAGAFDITASTTSKRTYRVVAHSVTLDSHTYKRRVTPSVTVTPVSQTAKVKASLAVVHVGQTATLSLSFTPVRNGRPVYLHVHLPNGTVVDEDLFENGNGHASYSPGTYPGGFPGTYKFQAIAPAWHGAPQVKSSWISYKAVD